MSTPRNRKPTARRASRRKPASTRNFWGAQPADDEDVATVIRSTDHPTALVRSLGPPPLPGGQVAQHYFDAVYERAAALAVALAASVGLSEELDED